MDSPYASGIMASVEQIIKEALALPSAARALLAEKLVESLEFNVDETLQTLWTEGATRKSEIGV